MVGVGPHSNLQSLDSYIANIRLRLCRLENHVLEVPCANAEFGYPANVTCFAMQRHLIANSASSELPPEPFVVPSFMGPATEFPSSLFSDETRPDPANFINYSSTFKSLKAV
ncbi:hypothetical protein YC2023_010669 [Brassica napus]